MCPVCSVPGVVNGPFLAILLHFLIILEVFLRILMPYFFKNCLIYMVNEELGGNRPFFKPMLRFYPDFGHFLHSEPFLTVLEAFACRLP